MYTIDNLLKGKLHNVRNYSKNLSINMKTPYTEMMFLLGSGQSV